MQSIEWREAFSIVIIDIVEEDKGMPKGWLYHLGRHDRNGKAESRDTFGRKLAC